MIGHSLILFFNIGVVGGLLWYRHGFYYYFPMLSGVLFGLAHGFVWFINVNHWTILNESTTDENVMNESWAV